MPDIEVGIRRMTNDRYELTVAELFVGDSNVEQQLANSGDTEDLLEIHLSAQLNRMTTETQLHKR